MTYYAGIDAGQSGTVAAIGDETRVLGRGMAGPADEIGQGLDSTRLHDALLAAYREAASAAKLPADARCAKIVAGVSGYEGRVYGRSPELPTDELVLMHDAVIAHAGALAGDPGAIVIAGTGTVAYGTGARGQSATVGGWGYLFGDEGGAFWLARRAVTDAIRAGDRGEEDSLGAAALHYFEKPTLHALVRAFYAGEITRAQFASFSEVVLDEARRGDKNAERYVREGARALAELALLTLKRIDLPKGPVAFLGGLTKNPLMKDAMADALHAIAPHARQVEARHDAAEGALLLARKR